MIVGGIGGEIEMVGSVVVEGGAEVTVGDWWSMDGRGRRRRSWIGRCKSSFLTVERQRS